MHKAWQLQSSSLQLHREQVIQVPNLKRVRNWQIFKRMYNPKFVPSFLPSKFLFSFITSELSRGWKVSRQPAIKHTKTYIHCAPKNDIVHLSYSNQFAFHFQAHKEHSLFSWLHKHSSPRSHASCMLCLALINHFNSISGEIAPEMVSRFLCWHDRGEWGLNHGWDLIYQRWTGIGRACETLGGAAI